jgi:hypothetical protein
MAASAHLLTECVFIPDMNRFTYKQPTFTRIASWSCFAQAMDPVVKDRPLSGSTTQ